MVLFPLRSERRKLTLCDASFTYHVFKFGTGYRLDALTRLDFLQIVSQLWRFCEVQSSCSIQAQKSRCLVGFCATCRSRLHVSGDLEHFFFVEHTEGAHVACLASVSRRISHRTCSNPWCKRPVQSKPVSSLTSHGVDLHHALKVYTTHLGSVVHVSDGLLDLAATHRAKLVLRHLLQRVEYLLYRCIGLSVFTKDVLHSGDSACHGFKLVSRPVGLELLDFGTEIWKLRQLIDGLALLLGHLLQVRHRTAHKTTSGHLVKHASSLTSRDATHLRQVSVGAKHGFVEGVNKVAQVFLTQSNGSCGGVLHISGGAGHAIGHDGCRATCAVHLVYEVWIDLRGRGHKRRQVLRHGGSAFFFPLTKRRASQVGSALKHFLIRSLVKLGGAGHNLLLHGVGVLTTQLLTKAYLWRELPKHITLVAEKLGYERLYSHVGHSR